MAIMPDNRKGNEARLVVWLFHALATFGVIGASKAGATTYSSKWQGIRTRSGADGYLSRESGWNGFIYGDDNRGNRWLGSKRDGIETWTVRPRDDGR